MNGAEVVIEGLRACGLHIDGYTAGDLVDISDAVLAALEAAGFAVVPRETLRLALFSETYGFDNRQKLRFPTCQRLCRCVFGCVRRREMSGEYDGIEDKPELVAWCNLPGRGTTFSYDVAGHDVQIYVTGKRKQVRIFLDHVELVAPSLPTKGEK